MKNVSEKKCRIKRGERNFDTTQQIINCNEDRVEALGGLLPTLIHDPEPEEKNPPFIVQEVLDRRQKHIPVF